MSDRPMSERSEAPCGECGRPLNRRYVEVGELKELLTEWDLAAEKELKRIRERQRDGKDIDYNDGKERALSRCIHDLGRVIDENE